MLFRSANVGAARRGGRTHEESKPWFTGHSPRSTLALAIAQALKRRGIEMTKRSVPIAIRNRANEILGWSEGSWEILEYTKDIVAHDHRRFPVGARVLAYILDGTV